MDKRNDTVFKAIVYLLCFSTCTLMILIMLNCCTYSINMVHSQGTSTDAIDEEDAASPTLSPNVNLTGLPTP